MTIRPLQSGDLSALQRVLHGTDLFPADLLPELTAGYLSGDGEPELWFTLCDGCEPTGFCYAAPEMLTEGTWNMRAIAVLPAHQARGGGSALVAHLETELAHQGARIVIADTSGVVAFAPVRAFYRRNGYDEEARIRDFWAAGDDKVTFRKSLI